jgi:adenylylsulfate kinase
MKTLNITHHNATVTRDRRNQLNEHKSAVIWFTGLSSSGKSTLAHSAEEVLYQLGCRTFVLDGDNVRHGLSSNLTFGDDDRKENVRRIGEVAKLMMEAGIIAMTAFISPFKRDRNLIR